MTPKLPNFKYHPDPLKTEVIIKEEITCQACNKKSDYKYVGPFCTNDDVENICPWCIENGSAAEKFDGEFQDTFTIEAELSDEVLDELIHKTPGYCGWQQEQWLVHCKEPCAFLGYVGWQDIAEIKDELAEDIQKQADLYGLTIEEFANKLINGSSMQGYLFKCVKCGKHRLTVDCD